MYLGDYGCNDALARSRRVRIFRNAAAGRLGHHGSIDNQREAAMLGDVRNLKTSDIELEQRLPALECEWLVGQMRSRAGIAAARCASDRHLTVQYNADELVTADILDFLSQCGVRVAAVRPAGESAYSSGANRRLSSIVVTRNEG